MNKKNKHNWRISIPHIVIIGGGASGLELATLLGNSVGKKNLARITLINNRLIHIWKPLWHEVAAGTLTNGGYELNYFIHAHHHHFEFQIGNLTSLDRKNKKIKLERKTDDGILFLPSKEIYYDILVIAIGSISNDFNTPGVKKYCFSLDTYSNCESFHQHFLIKLIQLREGLIKRLDLAIIGGGATGIELAAELEFTYQQTIHYNLSKLENHNFLNIVLIEASAKILYGFPEKIVHLTRRELKKRKIKILENKKVTAVTAENIIITPETVIPAEIKVWTAGIKSPNILTTLGLEYNQKNQLLVHQNLQTTYDSNIFALGDCASCAQPNGKKVPPTAQAAHQEALLLAKSLKKYINNKPLLSYNYHHYGSFITLGKKQTLGSIKNKIFGQIFLNKMLAKLSYIFLYRKHQAVLHGWRKVFLLILADIFSKATRPQIKLH